jgi:hypothetical protein
MEKLLLIVIVTAMLACKHKGKHNSNACNGDTRREVKLLTDSRALTLVYTPIVTTIDSLGAIVVPNVKTSTLRLDLETHIYTVTGIVNKVKKEWDGDYHIRLKSNSGNYIICEVPNPNCEYATNSKHLTEYNNVIDFIKTNNLEGKTVTITGVAFVDIDHYYSRKQARNNLELHPILKIKF